MVNCTVELGLLRSKFTSAVKCLDSSLFIDCIANSRSSGIRQSIIACSGPIYFIPIISQQTRFRSLLTPSLFANVKCYRPHGFSTNPLVSV